MRGPRVPPPWIFGITCIPFGVAGGFTGFAMPFLLRRAGISVEDIGWFVTASFLPTVLQFLYAPVIDLGPRRREWLVIVSVLGAACFAVALSMPLPGSKNAFLSLVVAGQWLTGLVGSCNGGLMATVLPTTMRGRAGGFYNAGNLGGGALGAGVTMTLVNHHQPPLLVGLVTAAMIAVPSLAALLIEEPRRSAAAPDARALFGGMFRDVSRTARSRPGWTGILFCLSPVGTAALINQFSALGPDYHADMLSFRVLGVDISVVEFVNGYLSGLVSAVGALIGGALCDRMNRRHAYLLSGALTAACGLAMALAGTSPMVYVVGVSVYLFVSGFCYAAFSAVVLEAIGNAGSAAATEYTLFTSAGNAAIMYTGFIDTRFHHRYGPAGLLCVDGALNLIGIGLLLSMMRALAARQTRARSLQSKS